MKRLFLVLFVLICVTSIAQESQVKYVKNKFSNEEVPQSNAKFSKTTFDSGDSVITVITDLKTGLRERIIYVGEEPFGAWRNGMGSNGDLLDFNFTVHYGSTQCINQTALSNIDDFLKSNPAAGHCSCISARPVLLG